MSAVAVTVEYDVKPECREALERVVRAHAEGTLADEDGRERFDVLIPREDIGKMMVYEVYRDAEALAVHNRSPPHAPGARGPQGPDHGQAGDRQHIV